MKDYRARRDFTRTAEPDHEPARKSGPGGKLSYLIQKHDATRLHYDFRLEWEGVLKSWAVTRGPSLDPSEKRLAVRTEDHPLSYGGFEGTIPEKEYGGGTVMLWDKGEWTPEGDPDQGLKDGKLTFELHGERLKGKWSLVRMHPRKGEKRENWLLIKNDDEEATRRGDVLNKFKKSVESDRTMAQIARSDAVWHSSKDADHQAEAKLDKKTKAAGGAQTGKAKAGRAGSAKPGSAQSMPRWQEPQLATLVDTAPEGNEWLSEMKYDGYRALIAIAGGKAKVFTRNGKDWTDKFPEIAAAAAALHTDGTLLDGEVVAFSRQGKTDFSALQAALKSGEGGLSFFVFDLIREAGEDLTGKPLIERKERLEALLAEGSAPLVYSSHVKGNADRVYRKICEGGHEGIVAKRVDSVYRSGRGGSWLKVKCSKRQELVIGGYSPSDKKGRPFSSILLGVNSGGKFIYKGRVGTGFDDETLDELAEKFAGRGRKTSPFDKIPRDISRNARFLTPDLVAEIEFAEFTADGMVRHGVFKGLRKDKNAGDVVLEKAGKVGSDMHEIRDVIAGVKLTHPEKILFDTQGVTKADIAAHYERVAGRMLPYLQDRLVSLVRCPDGETGQCFFQKHDHKGFPKELKRSEITEKDGSKDIYLHADDLAGLIAAVQMGTLEFHIWGSRIDKLENPDRLVFDLDPDESLRFSDVRDAAFDFRDRLQAVGLKTVPMLTGGKGIHVVAPLERRAEWPDVKAFARGFARMAARQEPERYLAQASKEKRKGRIFVDWLRNERGATAIAPYSTRSRKNAPVATPVSWDELSGLQAANAFHIGDMTDRMKDADPWAESSDWRQSVTKAMLEAAGDGD